MDCCDCLVIFVVHTKSAGEKRCISNVAISRGDVCHEKNFGKEEEAYV